MLNLIFSTLKWAMIIGVAGGLVDATIAMRNKAVGAHRLGLISLSQLNHALESRPHRKVRH